MSKFAMSIRLNDLTRKQLDELTARYDATQASIVSTAIDRMYQQEIETMTTEKNLTDNAWVERVNELRQIVSDLNDIEAPSTMSDIDYMLTSPDIFGSPDFDKADRVVLERELKRHYCIE
jgi:predicted transcriptional regulator